MFFQRYYLGCLAHGSYMIADEETKVAAVIDPQRDIDQHLADAAEHGIQIKYVFLTHFHADFVAGHIELRDKAGAKIYLGEQAQAEYEFAPVKDEWNESHIADSVNIPLNHLAERSDEFPRDRTLVVQCGSGYRSPLAASMLPRDGFSNVLDLAGRMEAWRATHLPAEGVAAA